MSVYYGPKDILARNEELVGESTQNLDFSFSLCELVYPTDLLMFYLSHPAFPSTIPIHSEN